MNKEEILEVTNKVFNEIDNELDFDYEYSDREITDDDLYMLRDFLTKVQTKMELTFKDEYNLTKYTRVEKNKDLYELYEEDLIETIDFSEV